MIPEKDGIYSSIEESDYHADRGSLSVSGAKLLLPPSCPARFRWLQDHPEPPKRVWDFGTVAHRLLLGKGAEIVEVEHDDFRTKAAREARDKAYERGQVPILSAELERAHAMVTAVLEHPIAGPIFTPLHGYAEQSVYAHDPETGVRLRCRPDWLCDGPDGRLWCVDYKTSTTANPTELVRKWWQLGYFMQAAWYLDVLTLAGIAEDARFVFVVTEKEPPHITTVVEYDAEAIAEGQRLNRRAINLYAKCREHDEWPAYTDQIAPLSLPHWALRDSAESQAAELIAELEGITS